MLSFCFLNFVLFFVIKILHFSKSTLFKFGISKKEKLSMDHLPQELVSNILSRLPSRELLKCKCVSKSWFHLIANPYFTTNYYSFHNNLIQFQNQEENLLIIQRPFISSLKTNISLLSWKFNDPKKHVSSVFINPPKEYNSDHKYWSEIIGPCNGIYFLEGNPNVLMNPSLRQFKSLPQFHLSDSNVNTYSLTDYSSFGFDSKTNDYKVVVLKDVWLTKTDERQKGYLTAELYSLNSNSWRKFDDETLPLPIEIYGSSSKVYTFVNHCCHWFGYVNNDSEGTKENVVLSFDMVNEVFRKIKVPKICESLEEGFITTLEPFEECSTIGFIVYPIKGNVKNFDVWVMRDYWDEGSWIKHYSIGPIEVIDRVMGFIGNNCFLWKCSSDDGLVLHQHDSQKIRDLKLKDCGKYDDSLRAVVYKESLVSLHREDVSSYHFVHEGITLFN